MLIGICDDDYIWCGQAEKSIMEFASNTGQQIQIVSFYSEEELREWQGPPWDIMFMDIELGGEKNGIVLAREVNERFPCCQIVFLTDYLIYALDIFHVKHAYFVLKEQLEERLPAVFDKVIHQEEQSARKMLFSASWGRQIIVRLSDLYYLERELRYTIVHTSWGDFQIKEKLDDLIHTLPSEEFSRCHHSYIIYFPAVREKRKSSYVLENGKEIAISRSYIKQTNDDWVKWVLTQMS